MTRKAKKPRRPMLDLRGPAVRGRGRRYSPTAYFAVGVPAPASLPDGAVAAPVLLCCSSANMSA